MKRNTVFSRFLLLCFICLLISNPINAEVLRHVKIAFLQTTAKAMKQPKNSRGHYVAELPDPISYDDLKELGLEKDYVIFYEPRSKNLEFLPRTEIVPDERKNHKSLAAFIAWKLNNSEKDANGAWVVKLSKHDAESWWGNRSLFGQYSIINTTSYSMGNPRYMDFPVYSIWTVVRKEDEKQYKALQELGAFIGKSRRDWESSWNDGLRILRSNPFLKDIISEEYKEGLIKLIVDGDRKDGLPDNLPGGGYIVTESPLCYAYTITDFLNTLPPSVVNDVRVKRRIFDLAWKKHVTTTYVSTRTGEPLPLFSLNDYYNYYKDYANLTGEEILALDNRVYDRILYPDDVDFYLASFPNGRHVDEVNSWKDGGYMGLYREQADRLSDIIAQMRQFINTRGADKEDSTFSYDEYWCSSNWYRWYGPKYAKEQWEKMDYYPQGWPYVAYVMLMAENVKEHRLAYPEDIKKADQVRDLLNIIDGFWAMDNEEKEKLSSRSFTFLFGDNRPMEKSAFAYSLLDAYDRAAEEAVKQGLKPLSNIFKTRKGELENRIDYVVTKLNDSYEEWAIAHPTPSYSSSSVTSSSSSKSVVSESDASTSEDEASSPSPRNTLSCRVHIILRGKDYAWKKINAFYSDGVFTSQESNCSKVELDGYGWGTIYWDGDRSDEIYSVHFDTGWIMGLGIYEKKNLGLKNGGTYELYFGEDDKMK